MRPAALIPLASMLFLVSCGYVGCGSITPVVPPSPMIPPAIQDLAAVERGDKLVITFSTPPRTTDNVRIKRFSEIDLRAGQYPTPFDFDSWADGASRYELPLPAAADPDDLRPIPVTKSLPVDGFAGQRIAIAVRTAVKRHDHFSSWSNVVRMEVIAPLQPPMIKAEPSGDGMRITWQDGTPDVQHRILRRGINDKTSVVLGTTDKPEFVDATALYDVGYVYTALAVKGDAESLLSEPVTVRAAKNVDTFPPKVPAGVAALATPATIELSWERGTAPDLKGYYVYRSVNGGAWERQGGLMVLPAYSDTHVEHGKAYRYEVSAIDQKGNESAKSAAVEVKF